ncbi:MAG: hypothetical protein NZ577_03300, partial [Vicinamibacterales bacterium]|nr:hypothetical protein [Vicinamibacterales bacterium]
MAVNHNSVARPHRDANNQGPSLVIGLGQFTGGELTVENKDYDIRNRAFLTDGRRLHRSRPFEGNRWSLILFAHTKWKELPTPLQRTLIRKGLRVPDGGRRGPLAKIGPQHFSNIKSGVQERTVMEYCCGNDSRIITQLSRLAPGTTVVRKTEACDMTRQRNVDLALLEIQRAPYGSLLLWCSIPCTGGTPFRHKFLARWRRDGEFNKIEQHEQKRETARILWENFKILADQAHMRGHTIVMEWPIGCEYWRWPTVESYLQTKAHEEEEAPFSVTTDGCMFGMTNAKGQPILKTWRFTIFGQNDEKAHAFLRSLTRTCDGSHLFRDSKGRWVHGESRGADLKDSENYPVALATLIAKGFIKLTEALSQATLTMTMNRQLSREYAQTMTHVARHLLHKPVPVLRIRRQPKNGQCVRDGSELVGRGSVESKRVTGGRGRHRTRQQRAQCGPDQRYVSAECGYEEYIHDRAEIKCLVPCVHDSLGTVFGNPQPFVGLRAPVSPGAPRSEMAQLPSEDFAAVRKREATSQRATMDTLLRYTRRAHKLTTDTVPECPPAQYVMTSSSTSADDTAAPIQDESTDNAMTPDSTAVPTVAGESATTEPGRQQMEQKESDSSGEDEFALAARLRADELRTDSKMDFEQGFTAHCSANNRYYPTELAARAMDIEIGLRNLRQAHGPGQGPQVVDDFQMDRRRLSRMDCLPVTKRTTEELFERDRKMYATGTGALTVRFVDLPLGLGQHPDAHECLVKYVAASANGWHHQRDWVAPQCIRCVNVLLRTCRTTYVWFWPIRLLPGAPTYGNCAQRQECDLCHRNVLVRHLDICTECLRHVCDEHCLLMSRCIACAGCKPRRWARHVLNPQPEQVHTQAMDVEDDHVGPRIEEKGTLDSGQRCPRCSSTRGTIWFDQDFRSRKIQKKSRCHSCGLSTIEDNKMPQCRVCGQHNMFSALRDSGACDDCHEITVKRRAAKMNVPHSLVGPLRSLLMTDHTEGFFRTIGTESIPAIAGLDEEDLESLMRAAQVQVYAYLQDIRAAHKEAQVRCNLALTSGATNSQTQLQSQPGSSTDITSRIRATRPRAICANYRTRGECRHGGQCRQLHLAPDVEAMVMAPRDLAPGPQHEMMPSQPTPEHAPGGATVGDAQVIDPYGAGCEHRS